MIKRFLIITGLIVASCSIWADVASYNISWDEPVAQDLVKMHIYKWEGKDTTTCPFFEGISLDPNTDPLYYGFVDPYSTSNQFIATADGDSTFISVVAQYEDDQGNISEGDWAHVTDKPWSHFLVSKDVVVEDPTGTNVSH